MPREDASQQAGASAWRPFAHPVFRRLWMASVSGHLANWMQQVGAASLMAVLTPSPMMVALVQTAASLPSVVLGLLAGALADLVERRRWLIFTQLWLLSSALLGTALVASGAVSPWGLLALTLLLGVGFALQAPASQAVIGEVVPRADVPAALGLASVGFNVSRIAGPALAGVLVGLGGGTAVYLAVAACSVVVLTIVVRWQGLRRHSNLPPESLISALRSGVRFVRHTPQCVRGLHHVFVFTACGSGTWALLPVLARDAYGLGAGGYGGMLGAFGLGGVLGVLLTVRLRRRSSAAAVVVGSVAVFGAVTGLLAAEVPLPLAIVALVLGGVAWTSASTTIYAAVQLALPDWVRARGVSIYNLVYFLAMAGGSAVWGAMASTLGLGPALGVAAGSLLLAAMWAHRVPLGSRSSGVTAADDADAQGLSVYEGMQASADEPVLVQIVYRLPPEATEAFLRHAPAAGQAIQRNGARFWRLYRDLEQPRTYIERYMVDSLGDLRRQSERMTPEDRAARRCLAACLAAGEPEVSHYAVQRLSEEG